MEARTNQGTRDGRPEKNAEPSEEEAYADANAASQFRGELSYVCNVTRTRLPTDHGKTPLMWQGGERRLSARQRGEHGSTRDGLTTTREEAI